MIDVPGELSDEQRRAVDELSKVMNGNPRERILREAGRGALMAVRRTRITASVDHDRGVFMISVAAELAEMHPQTLRMYEARGLIEPKRSPKGTRLYSHADVQRLRRIQELTSDAGMNLAGVEKVFELEEALARMQRKVDLLERRAEELQDEIARLEEVKRSVKAEIVRYEAVSTDLVRVALGPAGRRLAPPGEPATKRSPSVGVVSGSAAGAAGPGGALPPPRAVCGGGTASRGGDRGEGCAGRRAFAGDALQRSPAAVPSGDRRASGPPGGDRQGGSGRE